MSARGWYLLPLLAVPLVLAGCAQSTDPRASDGDAPADAELTAAPDPADEVLHITFMMDYGQFTLWGGNEVPDDTLGLLEQAFATPPSVSDGHMVLVLSPHQNNFAMPITIEHLRSEPASDADSWEQVSVERLAVNAAGEMWLESPTLDAVSVATEPGDYWVEISGRGFVNYGWPGSTESGDEWRLRLWPATGHAPQLRQQWDMPGFGTFDDLE